MRRTITSLATRRPPPGRDLPGGGDGRACSRTFSSGSMAGKRHAVRTRLRAGPAGDHRDAAVLAVQLSTEGHSPVREYPDDAARVPSSLREPTDSIRTHARMPRPIGHVRVSVMAGSQHITMTVRYEPRVSYGTSLAWIAPELKDAGLALIDDHLDDPMPSRTWAGSVDSRTIERFAKSWGFPRENQVGGTPDLDDGEDMASYARTYDGMNWEVGGESPIISVSVHLWPDARLGASRETCVSAPRRGSDRPTGALRSPMRRSMSCTSWP